MSASIRFEILKKLDGDLSAERMNILVRRNRRDYDYEPAVCVELRYSYSPVWAQAVTDHKSYGHDWRELRRYQRRRGFRHDCRNPQCFRD